MFFRKMNSEWKQVVNVIFSCKFLSALFFVSFDFQHFFLFVVLIEVYRLKIHWKGSLMLFSNILGKEQRCWKHFTEEVLFLGFIIFLYFLGSPALYSFYPYFTPPPHPVCIYDCTLAFWLHVLMTRVVQINNLDIFWRADENKVWIFSA